MQRGRVLRAPCAQEVAEETAVGRAPSGPVRDDEVREVEQLVPAVPRRQAEECVHPNEQAERLLREVPAEARERIDRVRGALTLELARVRDELRLALDRGLDEPHPELAVADRYFLVRRGRARNEVHALEVERLLELERRAQVPVVNRIEGAAEDADRPHTVRARHAFSGRDNIAIRSPVSVAHGSAGNTPLSAASTCAACVSNAASWRVLKRRIACFTSVCRRRQTR